LLSRSHAAPVGAGAWLNQPQEKLYDKVHDLEKFEEAVVGRELQMINIKRELQDTKRELERLKQNGRG